MTTPPPPSPAPPGPPPVDDTPRGPVFWVSLAVGWAVMGWAVVGVLGDVWLRDRPLEVVRWAVATLLVHDLVLAPVVTIVGLGLARLLPPAVRGPVSGAVALSGLVLLFAYPLLRAFGRRDANPTILPLDYPRNVVIILVAIWVVAGAVVVTRRLRPAPGGRA